MGLPRHGSALGFAGHILSASDAQWVLDAGADLVFIGKAAIADHAFAHRDMADASYQAPTFPVTKDHLRAELLGRVLRRVLRDQLAPPDQAVAAGGATV